MYDDWMIHGEKKLTKGGNPKPPQMDDYLNWIVEAWASIPKELIKKSFKVCGITNALDGSEDSEFTALKKTVRCQVVWLFFNKRVRTSKQIIWLNCSKKLIWIRTKKMVI